MYSGDANDQHASSACTASSNEQLTVSAGAPTTIATQLSASAIHVGDGVDDAATLSGATATAGGKVSYRYYSDSGCTKNVAKAGTFTVSNGVVPHSKTIAFDTSGTFYWQAVYSGDAANQSSASPCSSTSNEELTVTPEQQTTITTSLSAASVSTGTPVYDTATLSGATASAGGAVSYRYYSDSSCTQNRVKAGTFAVVNGVLPGSKKVAFASAGSYYWQALYSGDDTNSFSLSPCTPTSNEELTVTAAGTRQTTSVTTKLSASSIEVGGQAYDTATLVGATAAASGTVTYSYYTDNACSLAPVRSGTVVVSKGVVPNSKPVTFPAVGTFYWQASYSGDSANAPALSPCSPGNDEQLSVGAGPARNAVTITTLLSASTIHAGESVYDTASLGGQTATAGGSVSYSYYTDAACTQNQAKGGTVPVTNGAVPNSKTVTFPTAGTFYWQAVYSGDAANQPAWSSCVSVADRDHDRALRELDRRRRDGARHGEPPRRKRVRVRNRHLLGLQRSRLHLARARAAAEPGHRDRRWRRRYRPRRASASRRRQLLLGGLLLRRRRRPGGRERLQQRAPERRGCQGGAGDQQRALGKPDHGRRLRQRHRDVERRQSGCRWHRDLRRLHRQLVHLARLRSPTEPGDGGRRDCGRSVLAAAHLLDRRHLLLAGDLLR